LNINPGFKTYLSNFNLHRYATEALRSERNNLAGEVAALRRELDNRHEPAGGGGELEVRPSPVFFILIALVCAAFTISASPTN
jgi:hypothetical protein